MTLRVRVHQTYIVRTKKDSKNCSRVKVIAKAVWLRGYSGRLRTERSWVRNPHMLPPLVSQGDVVVPCKPELGLAALGLGERPCVVKLNIMGIPIR